ncbi:MAG: preprotein translocase subunit SecE [Planctomycetaceae bacterium]
MSSAKGDASLWGELFRTRLYKKNQGRLTRQVTAVAVWVLVAFGLYTLSQNWLVDFENTYQSVDIDRSAGFSASTLASIRQSAEEQGGIVETVEGDERVRVLFPTSRFWREDEDLRKQMREGRDTFIAEVEQANPNLRIQDEDVGSIRRPVPWITVGIPVALAALAAWVIFRLVNAPRFADFLISVEAEMDKVAWPGKEQLIRSTAVVIITMFFLAMLLFLYDVIWQFLFRLLGFLRLD